MLAIDQSEFGERALVEIGIAVGGDACLELHPVRIELIESGLDRCSRKIAAAVQTPHPIDAAMQIDDPVAAGLLMQPIDVLRDQAVQPPGALEAREGIVSSARPHASQPAPADRGS